MRDVVLEKGGPPLLIFGDSHVKHLQSFVRIPGHPKKLSEAFEHTWFCGVGGTVWGMVEDHVKGVDLPDSQKYLGNQWQDLKDNGFVPRYILISCGSNNCDQFHRDINRSTASSWSKHLFYSYCDMRVKSEYATIIKKIDSVLLFLKEEFPDAEILYKKILK